MTKFLKTFIATVLSVTGLHSNAYATQTNLLISNASHIMPTTAPDPARARSESKTITVAPFTITRYSTAHGKWAVICTWDKQPALAALCNRDLTTIADSPFKAGNRLSFEVQEVFIGRYQDLTLSPSRLDTDTHNASPATMGTSTSLNAGGVSLKGRTRVNITNIITLDDLKNLPTNPKRAILTEIVVKLHNQYLLGQYQTITLAYDDITDDELRIINYREGILQTILPKENSLAEEQNNKIMQ